MSDNRETGPQTTRGSHHCLSLRRRVHRQTEDVIKQPEEVINVCQQRNGSTDNQRKSSMFVTEEKGPQTNGGRHQCLLSEKRVHRQPEEVIKQPREVINVSQQREGSTDKQRRSSMSAK